MTGINSYCHDLGGLLSDVPENENDPTTYGFIGSAMVFKATSKEHALELAKSDIYATSGVWDMDKVSQSIQYPSIYEHALRMRMRVREQLTRRNYKDPGISFQAGSLDQLSATLRDW